MTTSQPSHTRSDNRGFARAYFVVVLLVVVDLIIFGVLGYKLWQRHQVNARQTADIQKLLTSARDWQKSHNGQWPEQCLIEPRTPKLCETGQDRDEIQQAASPLNNSYSEIYVIDAKYLVGDITEKSLINYGMSKGALILVNRATCFQGREISEGSDFAIIYPKITKNDQQATCG